MLKQTIVGKIRQRTGKQYPELERVIQSMDEHALHDLLRLLRDLEMEAQRDVRRTIMEPWRR